LFSSSFNLSKIFINAAHGHNYQAHENPPEAEQEDDDALLTPLSVLLELMEENADNNASFSLRPHEGQDALSLSLLLMHKYSKILPQFLHLNS